MRRAAAGDVSQHWGNPYAAARVQQPIRSLNSVRGNTLQYCLTYAEGHVLELSAI